MASAADTEARLDREVDRLAAASDPLERRAVALRLRSELDGLEAAIDVALERHEALTDDDGGDGGDGSASFSGW